MKRCPYCGKRISYSTAFASRKNGQMTCDRCKKSSKVYIRRRIYPVFGVFALISIALMIVFAVLKMLNNAWTILIVALPMLVFTLITPQFVCYDPLKKYKTSMEAKKAGIEYADNLTVEEYDINESAPMIKAPDEDEDIQVYRRIELDEPEIIKSSDGFAINSDVFNKIRADRTAAREILNSEDEKEKTAVPVISDVSEKHASTGAGLKKIHTDEPYRAVRRTHHYVNTEQKSEQEKHSENKTDNNRYSANRKF